METIRGVIKLNEPMQKHTFWKIGGHAKRYFEPADKDDLCHFLSHLPEDEPLFWIGLGSNLLVRDGGFPGTVVMLSGGLNNAYICDATNMHVDAGATCSKIARLGAEAGLTDSEFLAGIPGTMGGALAMNAGAFGSEIWDIVGNVETINRKGQILIRSKDDFEIGYRYVNLPDDEWFISARLSLKVDAEGQGRQRIKILLDRRSASQPIGQLSCGSVFRNLVNGDSAAKLIEASGLKGVSVGEAYISEKHANFIINSGGASARDVESLIQLVQEKVKQNSGVMLIPEVRIIGEEFTPWR